MIESQSRTKDALFVMNWSTAGVKEAGSWCYSSRFDCSVESVTPKLAESPILSDFFSSTRTLSLSDLDRKPMASFGGTAKSP